MFRYGNNDRSTRSLPSTFHDWLISNYCMEDGNAKISLAITLAEIGRKKRGLLDQRWLDESLVNSTLFFLIDEATGARGREEQDPHSRYRRFSLRLGIIRRRMEICLRDMFVSQVTC